jgi:PEP-CTERM motif
MSKQTSLIPALALIIIGLCAGVARADDVVLTSGSASTLGSIGSVDLFGPNFFLHYTGEIPAGQTTIPMNTVTLGLGLSNIVSFNGIESGFFTGLVSFNDSSLTGNVTAYASMEDLFFRQNPLFSVTFDASGFLALTELPGAGTERRFSVEPVPEPTTLVFLGVGFSAIAAFRRRRSRTKPPGNGMV